MLFFFGTRSSHLRTVRLDENTECPSCNSRNSFDISTFGTYIHFFWIPVLPISKSTVAECSHCKKTYREKELPESIKEKLKASQELDPPKRPIWHGCGCLIILAVMAFSVVGSLLGYFFNKDEFDAAANDPRRTELEGDLELTTTTPSEIGDEISYYLQDCMNYSIEGIETEEIQYFSKQNGNKLLVLLKVMDMKGVESSSRKEIVFAVEECLTELIEPEETEVYIGVHGKWNLLMTKTPANNDLGGRSANSDDLFPFYDADLESETDDLELDEEEEVE